MVIFSGEIFPITAELLVCTGKVSCKESSFDVDGSWTDLIMDSSLCNYVTYELTVMTCSGACAIGGHGNWHPGQVMGCFH